MKKINISLHPTLLDRLESENNRNNDLLFDNIYIFAKNVQKQKSIKYDLDDHIEKKQYFQKYLYTMNELFLSFNAFLVKKYIRYNSLIELEINKDKNWTNIYNNPNDKNKIEYLLSFFFEKDNDNFFALQYIHKFYIYENLFRNQICHGWIDMFYKLIDSEIEVTTIKDFFTTDKTKKPLIVNNQSILGLSNIRTTIKKDESIFLLNSTETYNIKISHYRPLYDEKDSKKYIKELIFKAKLNNREIDDILIDEYNKYISENPDSDLSLSKFMLNILQENKEKNQKYDFDFSLNTLLEDILVITNRL